MKRKSLLFALLMAVFAPLAMMAQETLTIYEDGTATSSNVPVHGLWADSYLKCEIVVPAEELEEMNGGTISQMDFYLTSPAAAAWTGTFQVFLKEVDNATISSYYGSGDATIVYEGTLDGTQSTMTVAFSDNYTYGGGNLLVGVYQIAKGNYKSATFAGASVTGASGQGYSSSSLDAITFSQKNFIPKTTFTYIPGGGVTCEKPESLEATNMTENGATLTWTGGSGNYNVEYKLASETEWTSFMSTTATTCNLTGLTPGTAYQARVQSVCGTDPETGDLVTSGWKSVNFTTACGAITNFPWTETFESYSAGEFDNPCWINERIQDGEGYGTLSVFKVYTSSNAGNTTHQLQLPDMPGGTLTKLVLPEMTLPANYEFSIDIYRSSSTYNDNYPNEGIRVYASTNGEIEGATELAFIPRQYTVSNDVIPAETATGWYTYELPIGMSGTCYIILRGESQYCTATYMDNLAVKAMPTCIRPTGLAVTANSVTAHNATITWTENGEANNWLISLSTESDFSDVMWLTVEDEPTYTFTGLDPETTYYVKVQAICGEDDMSESSKDVHFTTAIACPAPTGLDANPGNYSAALNWNGTSDSYIVNYRTAAYAEGIVEEFNTSGVPSGWTRYSGLVDDIVAGEATLTSVNSSWTTTSYALGQYNMKVNVFGTSCKYWLVTPEFNLSQNLSFDLALTDYGNEDPIEDATAQADDRFVVLIYAHEAWTILREWNNSGSEYVYNTISTTGENVTIDLSDYYGQDVKIAFYVESTATGGDNDLHIDNVICGTPYEAGEWQTITTTETTATITDLNPETAYEVKVQGDCGELDGLSLETAIVTFTTLEGCPVPQNVEVNDITYNSATVTWDGYNDSYNVSYRMAAHADGLIEHFDVSGVPSGWTKWSGLVDGVVADTVELTSTTSGWNTNSYALGQYNMKVNIYGTSCKYWLVSPEFRPSQDLNFDLALTDYNNSDPIENDTLQADDRFIVLVYADDAWHILREWNNSGSEYVYNTISATGENVTIDLSAYYGKKVKIAFYGESTSSSDENAGDNDLHIDNIVCGTPVEAGEWETVEATESPVVLTGLTPETPYEVNVQGICGGTETEWTEIVTFTTESACQALTNINVSEIGCTSVVLSWTENGEATSWIIYGIEDAFEVSTNPYTLTNLEPGMDYQLTVTPVCGADGDEGIESDWIEFTTLESTPLDISGYGEDENNWYLIASPLAEAVAPTEVGQMCDNEFDLYRFNQKAEDEWVNYKGHQDGFMLEPGQGYLYANSEDVTLNFCGTPNDYNIESLEVTLTNYEYAHPGLRGWNLVGNPFNDFCYIDDERDFYVMNEYHDELFVGRRYLNPMEGGFVYAAENGETITLTNLDPAGAKSANVSLNLSNGNAVIDRAIVRFGEGRPLPKFQLRASSTKLAIAQDNGEYAVVRSANEGEMPVSFKAEKNGTYTISVNTENVEFGYLHLIDNKTGNDVDLLATPSYSFEAKTTDYASRFRLVFSAETETKAFVYYNGSEWVVNGNGTMQMVDMTGRVLSSENVNGVATVNTNKLSAGVYVMRLVNGNDVKTQKIVVR